MKIIRYIEMVLLTIVMCTGFTACGDDDEQNSSETASDLQKYKWVYKNFDYVNGDDWVITDQETYTLYFVKDDECVIHYHCKHLDTDDGYSYTNKNETVKYLINGKIISFDNSSYINGNVLIYGNENLIGEYAIYEKQAITSSDRSWIADNYKNTELQNLNAVISDNVQVTAIYSNYVYHIKIKTSMSKLYPNAKFKYGIEYGFSKYDNEQYVGTNGSSYSINAPIYGCNGHSLYWSSYEALNKKIESGEKLTPDEMQLLNEIKKILKEDEKKYCGKIFVEVEGDRYYVLEL